MKPEWRPMSLTMPMPLLAPRRLDVRAADDVHRGGEGRLEAEAPVDEVDVVVDRLGDSDDADARPRRSISSTSLHRAAQRAVAADDEEDADAELVEAYRPSRAGPARRARCRAGCPPSWWMSAHRLRREQQRLVALASTRPA